jgi:hypothetical protein
MGGKPHSYDSILALNLILGPNKPEIMYMVAAKPSTISKNKKIGK